ncbi:MAG: hypothetical protein WA192_14375 [Candidatus Acidiferrales bacterium]
MALLGMLPCLRPTVRGSEHPAGDGSHPTTDGALRRTRAIARFRGAIDARVPGGYTRVYVD